MIRVLLVDDHPVVRAGLRAVLAPDEEIVIVGEVGTADEAIAYAAEHALDVVLMDLNLDGAARGGRDGVYATAAIRALADAPHVLILTTYATDVDIVRAVEAGATGYLLKDAAPEALLTAIRSAAAGETVLSPPVAARLLGRVAAPPQQLTARELEIVAHLAQGSSNQDIAKSLYISVATVKSHLVHIFDKLGATSRTQVVALARERGLID